MWDAIYIIRGETGQEAITPEFTVEHIALADPRALFAFVAGFATCGGGGAPPRQPKRLRPSYDRETL